MCRNSPSTALGWTFILPSAPIAITLSSSNIVSYQDKIIERERDKNSLAKEKRQKESKWIRMMWYLIPGMVKKTEKSAILETAAQYLLFLKQQLRSDNCSSPPEEVKKIMPTMTSDVSDGQDVELRSVALTSPLNRTLDKDNDYIETLVETSKGNVMVAYKGDVGKPAILTYHDLGLNYISNFQAFFNYPGMTSILQKFSVFHINAPGQEDNAAPLPDDYEYPDMEEMAEQVNEVINHMKIVKYIGIGVGLGGNVLLRHALQYPERVDSLVVVNANCGKGGWIEWGYQKRNIGHLQQHGVTQAVLDYLLWHHFGDDLDSRAHDLVSMYRHYFSQDIQPKNLAKLVERYVWRSPINIDREHNMDQKGDTRTLKVPILNMVGSLSPFVGETVTLNGKLNPVNTTWMKISDAAMILEEQPGKVSEALLLFLQGQGFCLHVKKVAH